MGGCQSKPTGVLPAGAVNTNPSNLAQAVHRERMMALKGIINNDGSRRPILKFLQFKGMEVFLNCYFEIEDLNGAKSSEVGELARVIIDRYKSSPNTTELRIKPGYEARRDNWKTIATSLEREGLKAVQTVADSPESYGEIVKNVFKLCQDEILSCLALDLDEFLESVYYRDWTRSETRREHDTLLRKSSNMGKRGGNVDLFQSASMDRPPATTRPDIYKNVLIVDDSKIATKIASLALSKLGHRCVIANHGRDALALLDSERFQIILIDLYMPIMDGFETIRRFREQQNNAAADAAMATLSIKQHTCSEVAMPDKPDKDRSINSFRYSFRSTNVTTSSASASASQRRCDILIVGMSSDSDPDTVNRAMSVGIDYFITKPFSVQALVNIIDAANTETREDKDAADILDDLSMTLT